MNIKLVRDVKHNHVLYPAGRTIGSKVITDKEARTLIRKGAAIDLSGEQVEELDDDDQTLVIAQLTEIDGINDDLAARLVDAGYQSIEAVANANPEDLQKVKGIGKKNVTDIMESAESLLESDDDDDDE